MEVPLLPQVEPPLESILNNWKLDVTELFPELFKVSLIVFIGALGPSSPFFIFAFVSPFGIL